ncbi:hypothetical protein [Pseudomonas fragariae (ex Marin et al. 2024)]|uniref:Uncharacterized protein n=2 Tax=Pseudomonas fragariae (ex Marin et al. 2024) TaxID=3080056 RepID=A0ABT3LDJ2_9PSED|nr:MULTISPECIES: hypothetical protein [unclassified Pseudomonas]MCW6054498.1 hypothetical protein [Pseudomonas fragi]MDV0424565.1 hypothetical protein [Pseudomonas sp. 17]MDX9570324.1 hypothetical protein [Pseudomonas sp. 21(2023)]MDX9584117.1 hypothetical protein [Pseudomonas sp. 19(2023)]MDX9621760.1 hypothetical protein [Pseudomonas sp. 20]
MKLKYSAGGRKPLAQARVIRALRHLNCTNQPGTVGAILRLEPTLNRSSCTTAVAALVKDCGLIVHVLPGSAGIRSCTLATHAHRAGASLSETDLRYFTRMENTALLMLSEHEKAKAVLTHGA